MITDTIVFLGPSLDLETAQTLLPNAAFHEPVRCGDIIKALRCQPKTLVIIDGFFERTAAVWHKEILLAMSQGVTVYGASSMGALRAAELHSLGMVGSGEVFQRYHTQAIIDDDEVALVHDSKNRSMITPMVNIRITLEAAVDQSIIGQLDADTLLSTLKKTPYYQRNLYQAAEPLPSLKQWLPNGYIDQKRLDAIELLTLIANGKAAKPSHIPAMTNSLFFNKIYRNMSIAPFAKAYKWLPPIEQQWQQLQSSSLFPVWQQIAKALHILDDIHYHESFSAPKRSTRAQALLAWAKSRQVGRRRQQRLKHLLIYHGFSDCIHAPFSIKHFTATHPDIAKPCLLLLDCLCAIEHYLEQKNLAITTSRMEKFAIQFRIQHKLLLATEVQQWLKENAIKGQAGFETFVRAMSVLYWLIDRHNLSLLGINPSPEQHYWVKAVLSMQIQT